MKSIMEQKITVVKIPVDSYQFYCLKCQTSLDDNWKFCPNCGQELNRGLQ